jgi:hypothetical protein
MRVENPGQSEWHTVRQGECLTSIARKHGISDPRRIHDHPDNAELKQKRPNPNILSPGDRVFIPPCTPKAFSCATDQTHRFVVRVLPVWLRVYLKGHGGRALANKRYRLELQNTAVTGTSGDDGLVEVRVPHDAEEGNLSVWLRERAEEPSMTWKIRIGHLDPIDDVSGVQARLRNLGFPPGAIDGRLGPSTRTAVADFQRRNDLTPRGELDRATLDRLTEKHGGS